MDRINSGTEGSVKAVSADFLAAVAATVRKVKAKIEVLWTDPYVLSGNTVTTDDENNVSWHDPHLVDTVLTTPHKYFILDGSNLLDDSYYAAPSTEAEAAENQFGWYTESVANEAGGFGVSSTTTTTTTTTTDPSAYPAVTVTFSSARPIKQIVIIGEPTILQYPTEFDIEIYDSGDSLLYSDTYPNAGYPTVGVNNEIDLTDESISTAKYMKLILKSWSEPNTIGKIVEFFGTVSDTFYDDDIVSMDMLEEREIKRSSLPVGNISSNELQLTLQNIKITRITGETYKDPFFPDNSSSYLQAVVTPNVRIKAYLGVVLPDESDEYTEIGTFWTNDWSIEEDKFSVSVSARDRIDIMRNVDFLADEVLENNTLYEIAEYLLEDAKSTIPMSDLEYQIDTELQNFVVPYCWFGKMNYAECLAKIAEACLGQVYMSKDDILIIESYQVNEGSSPDLTISRSEYFKRTQPINSSGLKNKVEVIISPLSPEETESEIATSDEQSFSAGETYQTVEILWDEDDAVLEPDAVIIEEDGITVAIIAENCTYYPWGAYIYCQKTSGTSGTFKILINGKKLINIEHDPIIVEDEDSQTMYGKKELQYKENFLIQSDSVGNTIAIALLDSYKNPRSDVIIDWIGNPALELGDTITVPVYTNNETGSTTTDDFIVYKQNFKFDGGLSCITEARKLITFTTTTTTTTSGA